MLHVPQWNESKQNKVKLCIYETEQTRNKMWSPITLATWEETNNYNYNSCFLRLNYTVSNAIEYTGAIYYCIHVENEK